MINTELLKRVYRFHGYTNESLATQLGINRGTLQKRLVKGDFKISEVQKMKKVIPLSDKDVIQIFLS